MDDGVPRAGALAVDSELQAREVKGDPLSQRQRRGLPVGRAATVLAWRADSSLLSGRQWAVRVGTEDGAGRPDAIGAQGQRQGGLRVVLQRLAAP